MNISGPIVSKKWQQETTEWCIGVKTVDHFKRPKNKVPSTSEPTTTFSQKHSDNFASHFIRPGPARTYYQTSACCGCMKWKRKSSAKLLRTGDINTTYPIVRLRFPDTSAFGPVVLLAVRGGRQLLQLGCPEPAVDFVRQQVGSVAALEIAEPTRCPDVFYLEGKREKRYRPI